MNPSPRRLQRRHGLHLAGLGLALAFSLPTWAAEPVIGKTAPLGASASNSPKATKDIVIDRVTAAQGSPAGPAAAAQSDAMVVSVLVESPEGSLTPRSTERSFRTGDRFRVRVLASRAGRLAFYNTNPAGVLGAEPVWRGEVQPGQETVSPRLALVGQRGVDQLHVVLEPATPGYRALDWLNQWLGRSGKGTGTGTEPAKDIVLDVQNTASATYLLRRSGQGLVTTVRIAHR